MSFHVVLKDGSIDDLGWRTRNQARWWARQIKKELYPIEEGIVIEVKDGLHQDGV